MTCSGYERSWGAEVDYKPIGEPVVRRDGVLVAMYEDNDTGNIICTTFFDGAGTPDSQRMSYSKENVVEYGEGSLEAGILKIAKEMYKAGIQKPTEG